MGNLKNQGIRPRGKTHVSTEPGEPLQVMQSFGWITIGSGDPLPVHKQRFSVAAESTEAAFIPAAEGFVTRIISAHWLCGDTATTLQFLSKGDGDATAISEAYANAANGGMVLPRDGDGHFADSQLDEGIVITTGAGSTTVGCVKFVRIPLEQFTTDNAGAILSWNDGTPV